MPNCSSSSSAIRQQSPGDRSVQSRRFYTSHPTVTLRYAEFKVITITPTSVPDIVEKVPLFVEPTLYWRSPLFDTAARDTAGYRTLHPTSLTTASDTPPPMRRRMSTRGDRRMWVNGHAARPTSMAMRSVAEVAAPSDAAHHQMFRHLASSSISAALPRIA